MAVNEQNGIVYVATEEHLVEEARVSAEIVRQTMGDVELAIATDEIIDPDGFDTVISLNNPSYGFKDKIQGMINSPFKKTLYLDTDIYMNESVEDLYQLLNQVDIAAAHNHNRDLYTNTTLGVPESFPEYNTGVIAFNKEATQELFSQWAETYDQEHKGDQPSFRKSLYESDLRYATLPPEYNYLPRYPGHIVKSVKILHGRLLDIGTKGADKNFSIEEVASKMNSGSGHRLFANRGEIVWPNLYYKILWNLRQRGFVGTAKAAINKYK